MHVGQVVISKIHLYLVCVLSPVGALLVQTTLCHFTLLKLVALVRGCASWQTMQLNIFMN